MIEIERKFLAPDFPKGGHAAKIEQGYLWETEVASTRIRSEDGEYILCTKIGTNTLRREEYENDVSATAGKYLMSQCKNRLRKTRYEVWIGDHWWDVDVFESGLIVAEVELTAEDEDFEIPEWVTEEVTDDPQYLNVNLAKANGTKTS